jgi:hypothetical protein
MAPWDWATRRRWRRDQPAVAATALFRHRQGQKRKSPLRIGPEWVGSGAAWLGVRASPSPAVPSRAGVGQRGATGHREEKGEEEEWCEADVQGPGVSEKEEKEWGRRKLGCVAERPDGPAGLGRQQLSWVGRLAPTV